VIVKFPMAELLFKNPQDYLQFEYDLRRARRPSYSMRAFARDLQMSPSGLNDFMKSRVGMSEARVHSISAQLKWSPERVQHFQDLLRSKFDKDRGVRAAALARVKARLKQGSAALTVDEFKTISEWHHLVILELCEIRDHIEARQIATELDISPDQASQALRRLIKLKLIAAGKRGYKPTEINTHFGDDAPSEAIRFFHSQLLERAQKALQITPIEDRDGQSMVFSVSRKDVAKMSAEIRHAISNIVNRYAQTTETDCIQALTFQVFPVWSEERELLK
jgi:uncharacterized protein (TIGR02147 family)